MSKNWPYFYGGQFASSLSKFYTPLTQNYTHWNLSHRYIHIYIVKKVGYKNIGKNQRLEAFYMLMERGQTDLPHNGVLCSLRKEWLFLFRHGAISQLLQRGKNYIARQIVCLHRNYFSERIHKNLRCSYLKT